MKTNLTIFIITILLSISSYSYADDDNKRARALLEAGDILSLESILVQARSQYAGKILEVELEEDDNLVVYEIELLTLEGKVIELLFDARTGKLISTEEED